MQDADNPFVMPGVVGPHCWGPPQWTALHQILRGYRPSAKTKAGLRRMLSGLGDLIPCHHCEEHFKAMVKANPPKDASREDVYKWSVDIHNIVNKRLGKPVLSYAQVAQLLTEQCANGKSGGVPPPQSADTLAAAVNTTTPQLAPVIDAQPQSESAPAATGSDNTAGLIAACVVAGVLAVVAAVFIALWVLARKRSGSRVTLQ